MAKRDVLHVVSSHVSNMYMYNQIVGLKRYHPIVYGGYMVDGFPFHHFVTRKNVSNDLKKLVKKYNIRLVHAHFGFLGAQMVGFSETYGIPLITHFRGGDGSNDQSVKEKLKREYARLSRKGAMFLPVCKALAPMLEDLGIPRERIQVLYGGIDLNQFPYLQRDYENHDKLRICFVGKTTPKKGLPILIEAYRQLGNDFNHLELNIVSSAPKSKVDRRELASVQEQITAAKLEDKVKFRFDIKNEDLHRELHKAHLFCHPSCTVDGNIEGIPNALKEAMATGLPCVSTRHAGIPELIDSGENGLLAPENDALALRDALGQLITNPELCRTFGKRARTKVEQHFDLRKQLKIQEALYDSVFKTGDGHW